MFVQCTMTVQLYYIIIIENVSVMSWLERHRLHIQIWQSVSDGESYVRASAVSCLYQMSTCARLWASLLESGLVTNEVNYE